ncbi:MAG: PilZ domain-containing protein [Acidiferrobacterales bacterium]|jgi:hypothetical protein|nr:PilZ domain-containing protein [Acidiferrobacterales bacterium]
MTSQSPKAYQPRKHHRRPERVQIYICVRNECGTARTKDVSEGGIAVDLATAKNLPDIKVGSIVSTRSIDAPHSSAMIGKIVRMDESELAIQFLI